MNKPNTLHQVTKGLVPSASNMILLGSSIANASIMSLQTGGEIAKAIKPIVDPADLSIVAYEVDSHIAPKHSLIRLADIRELSDMGMIVDSIDELIEANDVLKVKELFDLNFQPVGMNVTDEKRRKLGKITDFTVETGGFIIQQLIVRRPLIKRLNDTELVIHRSQIIEINPNSIVVHSTADVPEPERSEVSGSYINPFRKPTEAAHEISSNQS